MSRRFYRNGQATSLTAPVDAVSTGITVNSATSFPTQYPYTLILDPDGVLEEVVDVTAAVGNSLTIVRGVDGTTASPHSAGIQVYHGVSARDADEANDHVNKTTNVHGTTGSLVDTASTQSIPGTKNFTAVTVAGSAPVLVAGDQTIAGTKTFSLTPAVTGTALVTTTGTQTISGDKTFSGVEVHSGVETHSGTAEFTNAAMRPSGVTSSVDDWTTSATFVASNLQPAVGASFICPPSGQVWVHLSAYIGQDNNQYEAIVGFRIGTGATVNAGVETVSPSGDRSLVCGMAVNAAAPARLQAGDWYRITGLTPGGTYNTTVMMATTAGGKCNVYRRTINIIPIF